MGTRQALDAQTHIQGNIHIIKYKKIKEVLAVRGCVWLRWSGVAGWREEGGAPGG